MSDPDSEPQSKVWADLRHCAYLEEDQLFYKGCDAPIGYHGVAWYDLPAFNGVMQDHRPGSWHQKDQVKDLKARCKFEADELLLRRRQWWAQVRGIRHLLSSKYWEDCYK